MTGPGIAVVTRGDHRIRHPVGVAGCFTCKALTIGLGKWARSAKGEREILAGYATELELGRYTALREQGIQPKGTKLTDIEEAERESRRLGRPYDAADPVPIGELIDA